MAFEKLSAAKLKIATTAFAKAGNVALQKDIDHLEWSKKEILKRDANADVSELDYYIELRRGFLK